MLDSLSGNDGSSRAKRVVWFVGLVVFACSALTPAVLYACDAYDPCPPGYFCCEDCGCCYEQGTPVE